MTEANRCVHGVNPPTMCGHCARYYDSSARAAEQAKPETRQTHDIFAPGFSAADWLREHAAERAGEPQQPSTRELIATVRAGIGGQRLPSHQEGIEADEALTELEKRIGGE